MQFHALQVLLQFASAEECRELVAESPQMVHFCVENYANARAQPDHKIKKGYTNYPSSAFLWLLRLLSAASTAVCSELVRLDGLAELAAALDSAFASNNFHLHDALCASEILEQILLAETGRHVQTVRADDRIQKGVIYCLTGLMPRSM